MVLTKRHTHQRYKMRLKERIEPFTTQLFYALFDEDVRQEYELAVLGESFVEIADNLGIENSESIWNQFTERLPEVREKLDLDALAIEQHDPAATSIEEVYLAYPGFHAIAVYRLSHELYNLGVPLIPRMMTEYAHGVTGADIHPGAKIGDSFFIDHATGTVIGETSVIKENVKLYQGVTLGGLQVHKNLASVKRHPTIERNVIIYANATILGGDVVIGEDSIIGANVWITESIPPNSLVSFQPSTRIIQKNNGTNR